MRRRRVNGWLWKLSERSQIVWCHQRAALGEPRKNFVGLKQGLDAMLYFDCKSRTDRCDFTAFLSAREELSAAYSDDGCGERDKTGGKRLPVIGRSSHVVKCHGAALTSTGITTRSQPLAARSPRYSPRRVGAVP
jgi:hypothetical protein